MARIAVIAVVNVAAYTLMVLVGLRLQVAVRTREHREIIRVRVASVALAVGIAMVHREPGVVKDGIGP